jgi:hypothetical protein
MARSETQTHPPIWRACSTIRSGATPVFGFCSGFQLMVVALGVPLERIGRLEDGEPDPHPGYQPGWRTGLGYEPVGLVGAHPLHEGPRWLVFFVVVGARVRGRGLRKLWVCRLRWFGDVGVDTEAGGFVAWDRVRC